MELELIGSPRGVTVGPAEAGEDRVEPRFAQDAELARRILSGDGRAFDRFYEENVGRVYAVSLRLCGDESKARRLTQDAFVRAWERLSSYRGESRLSSWLHRLATNVALESGRRRSRWWSRLVPAEAAGQRADRGAADPGLRLDLEGAIRSLPPGAREALVLRDVEGHTYAEIAELTGTAIGTVKAQIHRARRLVRERLER